MFKKKILPTLYKKIHQRILNEEREEFERLRRIDPNFKPTKWEKFYETWIWSNKYLRRRREYDNVLDLLGEKKAFLEHLCWQTRWTFNRIWEWPEDRKRDIKWFVQRGKRGWSDCDVWGFSTYLAKVIVEGCEYLRDHKHGVPNKCFEGLEEDPNGGHTDDAFLIVEGRWNLVLDKIIFAFRMEEKIMENELMAPVRGGPYFTDEEIEKRQRMCDDLNRRWPGHRVMTKDEFEDYNLGWQHFRDYFDSLWD